MTPKVDPREVDRMIADLASRQHGAVATRQLLALGVPATAIATRVRLGRLHRIHRGVYAVGHPALSREGRWTAAVLAAGEGAVLSHLSAARLHGITTWERARVEVTVPTHAGNGRHPGLHLHRTRFLPPNETTRRQAIPVTSPARTLLDLAASLTPGQHRRAIAEAEARRLFDPVEVAAALDAHPGRPSRVMRRALGAATPTPVRSELERRFLRLCRRAGLPAPESGAKVAGLEVDALWRDARLVAELDGFAFHGGRVAFERDRERDALLAVSGFRVVRFTHRQVSEDPGAVATVLRELLT